MVPNTARPAPAEPVGELEAIPVLGANLLARPASELAIDASADILCRKGTATTSRWRGYDHKDAFEPAQAATAPQSDADVMGSWVKYDGSVPVTTPLDQAVRDEELPTSWYKYDEKPLASLLERREKPGSKAPIHLAEVPPPALEQRAQPEIAAAANSLHRAEPQPAPQPAQPAPVVEAPPVVAEPPTSETVRALSPEAEAETEISAAPIEAAAAEASDPVADSAPSAAEMPPAPAPQLPDELETQAAEPLDLSADPVAASEEPEASGDLPIEDAPAPIAEVEAAPVAFVPEPPVLAMPAEPMAISVPSEERPRDEAPIEPVPTEPPSSEFVGASNSEPEFPAAPIARAAVEASEPLPLPSLASAPELPSPAPASAVELPDQPEAQYAEFPTTSEDPEAPAAEIAATWDQPRSIGASEELEPGVGVPLEPAPAPMAEAGPEAAAAVSMEDPPVLAAPAEPMATSLPGEEPPRSDATIEPEDIASAVAAQEPEQPALDPDPGPDVETPAAAPAAETAAEATPSGAEPSDQRELLQMAVTAIKKPGSTKKAMLARLAEMLERALSAKRSAHGTGDPPVASEPEAPAPSSGSAEASTEAVQAEAFVTAEPARPRLEFQTPPEATEPVAPEIVADAVASVEAAIDPVPAATAGDAEAVQPEAFAPPEPAAPLLETQTPPEATEPAAPEIVADAVVPVETAIDPVPPATTGDADAVQHEAFDPPEPAGFAQPLSASSDAVVAEPPPEPEALLGSPPSYPTMLEPVAPSADTSTRAPESPSIDAPLPEMAIIGVEADEIPSPGPVTEPEAELPPEAARTSPQEPARDATADAISPVSVEQPESSVSPEELAVARLEPPPLHTHEQPTPSDEAPAEAPSAEDQVPLAADGAAYPAERASDPEPWAAAPIEAAPVSEAATPAAASAPVPGAPAAPIDQEQAEREALASGLADMIHNVLSTTQFATRAMKADRYSLAQSVQTSAEPEPDELGDGSEIAADAVPHPVAIRSRLGRMERTLALITLGMMILVGYFAISLWRDDGVVSAQAPVIAPAASSSSADRGVRARDAARELGAAAIESWGGPRPADRR